MMYMADVTQVAFQLDNDSLAALDEVAAAMSHSRAEVLRIAVREMLARRREADIDARLAAGYGAGGPISEDEQSGLAEASVDALRSADLDW